MKQSKKLVLIIVTGILAVVLNHLLTKGSCSVRDDVTMECIGRYWRDSSTLIRLFVVDIAIVVAGAIAFLKIASSRMKIVFFRLMGIVAIILTAMAVNHVLAPYVCLEYDDVAINGEIGCLQRGLTDEGENRVLVIDGAVVILGLLGAGKVLLSFRDKSSNVVS